MLNPTTGFKQHSQPDRPVATGVRAGRGAPGRCGRCRRTGDPKVVEVMVLDRIAAGAIPGAIPLVDVTLSDGTGRPYTVTVPERYFVGWRCRGRAECMVDGVPAPVSKLMREWAR